MEPGDRVLCPDGWFGTVEAVDGRFVDVRFDTPDGEPSCVRQLPRRVGANPPDPAERRAEAGVSPGMAPQVGFVLRGLGTCDQTGTGLVTTADRIRDAMCVARRHRAR